jgi:hypothetical protein
MITDSFLAEVRATTQRYEDRTPEREQIKRVIEERGVLHADPPALVEKRLDRLGVDWGLARAVERTGRAASTGRSLDAELPPETFGADVLALERMMGHNDLVDVGFLERGYLAGRSVGRISVGAPDAHYGTGFLISPRLLITNNHVLAEPAEAARGFVEMNFQAGLDGRALQPVAFALEPDAFFATDRVLDFTIVGVAEQSDSGAELHHGLAPVRRDRDRARHEREREHEQEQREQLHRLGDVGERRAETADVARHELYPLGRLELVGERGPHLLEGRRGTVPTSVRVSVTVFLSRLNSARCRSRTALRKRLVNARPPTISDATDSMIGRAASRSSSFFRTSSSVTFCAISERTLSSCSATVARLAN